MGTKKNPSRYDAMGAAEPDEPYFVLLGRDRNAGNLIRQWAVDAQKHGAEPDKVMEALACAAQMDAFAMEYHARPRPPVVSALDEG